MPRPLPAIDFAVGLLGSLLGVDVSVALGYALWKIIEYVGGLGWEMGVARNGLEYGVAAERLAREKTRGVIWFVLGLLAGALLKRLVGLL